MPDYIRGRLYRTGLACVVLALAYGLITSDEQVTGWTALIAALFGNGLATANTTAKRPGSDGE